MRRSVYSVSSLLVIALALTASTGLAAATSVVHEGRVDPGDVSWIQNPDGTYRVALADGRPLGVTDAADLPVRDLLLLVPADLPITDVVIEPVTTRREALPGPLAVAQPLEASNGDLVPQRTVEPTAGAFPATWGQFGGLHAWRGYRLLAVTVHPIRLDAGAQEIEVLEEFTVRAMVDPSLALEQPLERQRRVQGERPLLDRTLRGLIDNPAAVSGYARHDGVDLAKAGSPHLPAPSPSLDGSAVRYLIVTSAELAPEFERLADHRTSVGMPAKVVTREWIAANYRQGIDFQETLRFFLQEAYRKWGVEFVLIGGDTEVIPTRVIRSGFYPFGGHTDVPTDLYYAGLDGNWAADGDGWLGEPYNNSSDPGDAADFAADVDVARAPVRDPAAVQSFVDKLLAYELATPADHYANRILYAAEVLFPSPWDPGDPISLDGAYYAEQLIDDIIQPCTEMDILRMYETNVTYPYDAPLSREALIDSLNTGHYGQVNQFGHGHFFNMSVGDANFTVSDASALENGPNYFLMVGLNCASAAFDVSCLMEAFVENPDGGSIMSVGAAREAFPSNSAGYQQRFYEYMACNGTQRVATAFNAARLDYISNVQRNTVDRWTQLNAVVIGDPATTTWFGTPRVPELALPTTLTVGEQQVAIQVTHEGAPVAGADVCIAKGDESYDWGVTDDTGSVTLTIIPTTGGEANLTVAGANLAVTTTTLAVTGSETYLTVTEFTVDDHAGNGDGRPDSGETVDLVISVEDVGGAGATGLSAVLTSDHDSVEVLTGSVALPDVAPGGTATASAPFVVRFAESIRDGTLASLHVVITGNGDQHWETTETITVLGPDPWVDRLVIDDATYGDNDGVPESGERLVLRPYIKNFGAGQLDPVQVELVDVQPGVTVHSGSATFGVIGLLEEETYASGELSITLDDVNQLLPCRIWFTDVYGREFSNSVEFNPPAAPPLPSPDPTLAPDAIALRWDPVDDSTVVGYHVYRAESEDGPFVRANTDLLRGISYYEDRGLDQLTSYWYRVTAVDSFLTESPASPVVWQGTMPAELENFPLPFALQTSGHSAVGDLDGDGDLEIVLASDEVYAWHHDGTDPDLRTT